jgi:hypothetical protein
MGDVEWGGFLNVLLIPDLAARMTDVISFAGDRHTHAIQSAH